MIVLTGVERPEYANAAFYQFTGFDSMEDFLNMHKSVYELFIPFDFYFHAGKIKNHENWIHALNTLSDNKRIVSMEDRHNIPHAFAVSVTPFDDQRYILSFSDISSTMQDFIELGNKATHDPLTGAYNRTFLESKWDQITHKVGSLEKELYVIMLDIDHFKNVNDTYGHDRGDSVLKYFVKMISESIRNDDILIRWGGEEFILLISVTSQEKSLQIAEYLRHMIETADFEEIGHITCSAGVALHRNDENISVTIKRADAALYKAKSNGGPLRKRNI